MIWRGVEQTHLLHSQCEQPRLQTTESHMTNKRITAEMTAGRRGLVTVFIIEGRHVQAMLPL